MATGEMTGVLVVRVWIEGESFVGLRARLTGWINDAAPEYSVRSAAAVEDVCAGVRSWLDELLARTAPSGAQPRR
jgi:hypothetical protein